MPAWRFPGETKGADRICWPKLLTVNREWLEKVGRFLLRSDGTRATSAHGYLIGGLLRHSRCLGPS
jgi:hypothetical protein